MSQVHFRFDIYARGKISDWSAGKLGAVADVPQHGPTRLCDYFARMIGAVVSNTLEAPTVTCFAYGQGSNTRTFADALTYLRLMPVAGGNWNVEGGIIGQSGENSISMLSAFPTKWGGTESNSLYSEVGFASNYQSFMNIGEFANKTFLEEASRRDPLSLYVVTFAYDADRLAECQAAAKATLSPILKNAR